jgi:hypothetical protein
MNNDPRSQPDNEDVSSLWNPKYELDFRHEPIATGVYRGQARGPVPFMIGESLIKNANLGES